MSGNTRRMSLQYPPDQWNGGGGGSQPLDNYPSYPSQPPMTSYPQSGNAPYASDGYYQSAQPSGPPQSMYSSGSRPPQHHGSSYPYAQSPHPSHSPTHGHGYAPSYPRSPSSPTVPSRPRSHSVYIPQQSGPMIPPHAQYPQQGSLEQPSGYHEYPASPSRPFSCDLCALSFNRQHDLKRHRETHTGEKPYLCNGGCGKTFTRKDALKRHQLVKGCGKVDETWQ